MSTTSRVESHRQAPALGRETFRTSHLLDFCSEWELVKQIGHSVDHFDAAEETSTAPTIRIDVAEGEIITTDNGPGIPAETVAGILDFRVWISSREAYYSPALGAQGSALTIFALASMDGTA
jgi:DNA topoisomerase VI subunit B